MIKHDLSGIGVALVTPFKESKSIDFDSLIRLINYIKKHVNYLVILGTTAETSTLNIKEQEQIIHTIIEHNPNMPLIIGLGGNSTEDVIKKINNTNLDPFKAILSVCPFYNKPTQKGIYEHFKKISKYTPNNIIIYNIPSRTGVNIEPKTVIKLAENCKNIIGIKESSGNILQIYDIIKYKPKNFQVISGDDNLVLPSILGGCVGIISVIAQAIPSIFYEMINLIKKKKIKQSYGIYYQILKIIKLIFKEGNPVGIKSLLKKIKICSSPEVRLPLVKCSNSLQNQIELEYLKLLNKKL